MAAANINQHKTAVCYPNEKMYRLIGCVESHIYVFSLIPISDFHIPSYLSAQPIWELPATLKVGVSYINVKF